MNLSLEEIIKLLENLKPETPPIWGKMTAQHMLEHLVFSVRISNAKLKVNCFIPIERWTTMKKVLESNRPLPKNFINPIIGENLIPLEFKNIDESLSGLRKEFSDFIKYFTDNPGAVLVNPTFGELNFEEWKIFHHKHFTHHCLQFGLL